MKKGTVFLILALLFLAASALFYFPKASAELGDLLPVETLTVERQGMRLVVQGADVVGVGRDWKSALADLRASAPGTVFLETVERVAVAQSAADCLPDLLRERCLRPAVQLYLLRGEGGTQLEPFLKAHESSATLENQGEIPVILEEKGRYRFA